MTDQPEPLDLRSADIAEDRRQELLRLFPEVRTEGGKLDFERLKLELGGAVDVGKERYGMNWPGKAECFKTIQAPSLGTLRPVPAESVNFETTENLIIERQRPLTQKLCVESINRAFNQQRNKLTSTTVNFRTVSVEVRLDHNHRHMRFQPIGQIRHAALYGFLLVLCTLP